MQELVFRVATKCFKVCKEFLLKLPFLGEKEVGTEGKLLVLGCENSTIQGYGLQNRKKVQTYLLFACRAATACATLINKRHFDHQLLVPCIIVPTYMYILAQIQSQRKSERWWQKMFSWHVKFHYKSIIFQNICNVVAIQQVS